LQFAEFSASNLRDFQQVADAAFASLSLSETGRSLVLWKGGWDAVFSIANFASSLEFC
jgi:hypothetical protein